ncbi:MAG: hypothetical protein H8D45_28140 [Bacteroidetes bacterium]|nr:hypothetical protein [Bacteroidota bacterium]
MKDKNRIKRIMSVVEKKFGIIPVSEILGRIAGIDAKETMESLIDLERYGEIFSPKPNMLKTIKKEEIKSRNVKVKEGEENEKGNKLLSKK